jgi:hypothetical protein
MKTTEFIKESVDQQEYNDEAGMAKNSLHTIVRVATHLERELGDNENLPEWCQEKIAQIKGMMVSVMDYMLSQHEMGKQEEVPGFDADRANDHFARSLMREDASAGSSSSSGVGVVMTQLGETPAEMIKRQKSYTNQMTKGGPVKVKKAK